MNNGVARKPIAGTVAVKNYRPRYMGLFGLFGIDDDYAPISVAQIEHMELDEQVKFGLGILYGSIAIAKWKIKSASKEVADFMDNQLKQIWQHDLYKIVNFLGFGASGGEVIYDKKDSLYICESLADFHIHDMRPLRDRRSGKWAGISVVNGGDPNHKGKIYLSYPKAWWIAPEARYGEFYGRSRLQSVWALWEEKRGRKGAIRSRRQFFMKHAFNGGKIWYPLGVTIDDDGNEKDNQDIAMQILELFEAGGVLVFPNTADEQGKRQWEHEDAALNLTGAETLLEYPDRLDVQILKALGIPPEVVEAAETGSGYSGRKIPAIHFFAQIDRLVDGILQAIKRQVLDWLSHINFKDEPFEIEPQTLIPEDQPPGGGMPGMGGGPQPPPDDGGDMGGGGIEDLLGNMAEGGDFQLSHDMTLMGYRYTKTPPKDQSGWEQYKRRDGGIGWKKEIGGGSAKQSSGEQHTVDSLHQHVSNLLSGEQELTHEHVKDFAEKMMSMSVKDIQSLKQKLGLKASGKKAELANKIAERALKMTGKQQDDMSDMLEPDEIQQRQQAQQQDQTERKEFQRQKQDLMPDDQKSGLDQWIEQQESGQINPFDDDQPSGGFNVDFDEIDRNIDERAGTTQEQPINTQSAVEHLKRLPPEQLQEVLKQLRPAQPLPQPQSPQAQRAQQQESEQQPAPKPQKKPAPKPRAKKAKKPKSEKPQTRQQMEQELKRLDEEIAEDNKYASYSRTKFERREELRNKLGIKPKEKAFIDNSEQESKSADKQQPSKLQSSIRDQYDKMRHYVEYEDGPVVIPHLYEEMKRENPDLKPDEFLKGIQDLVDSRDFQYHILNEVREIPEDVKHLVPHKNGRYYYWINKKPEKRGGDKDNITEDSLSQFAENTLSEARKIKKDNDVADHVLNKIKELDGMVEGIKDKKILKQYKQVKERLGTFARAHV